MTIWLNKNNYFVEYINNSLNQNNYFVEFCNISKRDIFPSEDIIKRSVTLF